MPGGQGYRARTRDLFKRGFRQKGYIPMATYLTTYKLGDYVDIKVNGAIHKVCKRRWCGELVAPAMTRRQASRLGDSSSLWLFSLLILHL